MAIAFVRALPSAGTNGADATTQTVAFDATGCDCVLVGWSYGSAGGGNVTGATLSVGTYAGTNLTSIKTWVINAGSNTSGGGLYGILLPTTGSNNIVITMTGGAPATNRLTVSAVGYSGVASFGNTATYNDDGGTTGNVTINVTAATGNLAVAIGSHGDTISGVGASTTARGAINNRSTDTAGGCVITADRAGAGGTTAINLTSSISDHWTIHAVELVASGAADDALTTPRPAQLNVYRM